MLEPPHERTGEARPLTDPPAPPTAKRLPEERILHGDRCVDPYGWLRDRTSPEVLAYLEAENAYTAALMAPTQEFQQTLFEEMAARLKADDSSVPYRSNGYSYYARVEHGKQYAIYCRRREQPGAGEEVVLDLNELAEGYRFLRLDAYVVSEDSNLLAFCLDRTGDGRNVLYVKDLRTGELTGGALERVRSVVWASGETFFYTTEDAATRRADRLFRSTPEGGAGEQVYEETDPLYEIELSRSRDRRFIFITSTSKNTTEVRFIAAGQSEAPPTLITAREPGHRYYVEHHGGLFFIRTDRGAKNFRVVTAPVAGQPGERWKEFWPHHAAVKLEAVEVFARHCLLVEREDGIQHLRVINLPEGDSHRIEFADPIYGVWLGTNAEFDTDSLRFGYYSPVTPLAVFDYDMNTRRRVLLKRTEIAGGYDPSLYACERVFATAHDGTRIPVSLVYRKDARPGSLRPMLLYGYGAYGVAAPLGFSAARLSLLDRGVTYAIAHVRGGGEMGEAWHDAGKLLSKHNTFSDFIRVAEYLIAEGYTAPERLVVHGDSAGGMLIGAVINLRPQLFAAALLQVPFVDVLNTMLDSTLPLTSGEYLEWGDPNDRSAYEYIKSYSPYDNIGAQSYPPMLVKASFNDSQVMYWEAAKYVAKLRATKTDANTLLLKTDLSAGHAGAAGRYDTLRELAYDYAYILSRLGITR
jgi:oligopeptidase B